MSAPASDRVGLITIAAEWTRIGCVGFGGPPAHIALLRKLCVEDRQWLSGQEFEDGVAATNLLPGPASTQLAIFCAWRLRGGVGAMVGGVCFIVPGLVLILALSAVFLASSPPLWVLGAALGAGAAVPAVALNAAVGLMPTSLARIGASRSGRVRWLLYALTAGVVTATAGSYVVLAIAGCGLIEVVRKRWGRPGGSSRPGPAPSALTVPVLAAGGIAVGGLAALSWVALKVGALSYGGGFVIVPLMQHDAVSTYHWMTGAQFLNAVALGQITPGPVVQTVAAVGYAASGVGGGLLAALIAFAPSFAFVMIGGPRFDRLRGSRPVQAFLTGAGAAAIGAIAGAAIPLGLAFTEWWQVTVLAVAGAWLLGLRRGVVAALLGAGALGVFAALVDAPVGH